MTDAIGVDAPFAQLGPDRILDAVEKTGLRCDGRLLALNSYENRVWQVGVDDGEPVIVKFYRPGRWSDAQILEEHAFAAELAAAEVPAVAPLSLAGETLHHHDELRFAVSARQGGRTPELDAPNVRRQLGRLLGRLHAVGACRPFVARPTLSVADYGVAMRQLIDALQCVPPTLEAAYFSVADDALAQVVRSWAAAGDWAPVRLHGDCHAGNLLWTDGSPHFVDFDDARNGPALQDLWLLLSGEPDEAARQFDDLIGGYQTFAAFDWRQLHLLEALRTLRLIHHAGWIAQRWHDPAFPVAFPWFGTEQYWQQRILELREQLAAMQDPELVARLAGCR